MTDWWSNDPVASAPAQKPWWEQDATIAPAPAPVAAAPTAKTAAPEPEDPIKAQVRQELDARYKAGEPKRDPYIERIAHGLTMGWSDELLAGMMIPVQMLKRKLANPAEAYRYAKAQEDLNLEDAEKRSGALGTVGEIGGGIASGAHLFKAGATVAPWIGARLGGGLLGTAVGGAADGALYGAVAGAGEGDGLGGAGIGALKGAAAGATVGAAVPAALAGVGTLAAPIVSNVTARLNPAGYAERQIGRAAAESGRTGSDITDRIVQASIDRQPEFRLIDALGNPGRRMGAVVAKNPGEGRQALTEFLDTRQAGQGGRIANALEEGLAAPETAQAATRRMTAERGAAADRAYGQARADAGTVDTSGALAAIRDVLDPQARGIISWTGPAQPIAHDSVEAVLSRARSLLASGDTRKVGFEGVQRVKGDIDDAVGRAVRAGENNKARLLGNVARELDDALVAASPNYAGARDAFRQSSRAIDAVETGSGAASRGRSEDKIAAFEALRPEEQAGFRIGYADPLIERAQRSAMGTDASRPLTSLAARTELPAFAAPGMGDQMMRRLGREGEMFATRAKATGGSQTAENLADNAAAGVDPGIVGKLLTGDLFGAGRSALHRTAAGLSGNTEPVRAELAKHLLNGNAEEIGALLARLAAKKSNRSEVGAAALRGLIGGAVPLIGTGRATSPQRGR